MNNSDSGPSTRPPSRAVVARARAALMAQVRAAPLEADVTAPDETTLGRQDVEGAPRAIKKRYVALGVGAVAAVAGGAIAVAGVGPFGEDRGITPATPTESSLDSTEESAAISAAESTASGKIIGQQCLQQESAPLSEFSESFDEKSAAEYNAAVAAGPFRIETTHVEADYQVAIVTNDALRVICTGSGGSIRGRFGELDPSADAPGDLDVLTTSGEVDGSRVEVVTVGRVPDDVTAIRVYAGSGQERTAHIQDGFYSVALSKDDPDADFTYVVAYADGSTERVQSSALGAADPTLSEFAVRCRADTADGAQGVSDDEATEFRDSLAEDPPEIVVHRQTRLDEVVMVQNSVQTSLCVRDTYGGWGLTAGPTSSGSPDRSIESIIRAATERPGKPVRIAEVGRVARDVQHVVVETSRGDEAEAFLHDGYYSFLVDAPVDDDLTFVVTFDDGSTQRIAQP